MKRFWFEFDTSTLKFVPYGTNIGCGVTAYDYEDALSILEERVFQAQLPGMTAVIPDVDVRNLDQNHVIPNMSSPNSRGVWFPQGYD